jgi:predicted enzyme related to lactoylglutathione lyase
MINGVHALIYARDAEKARAFFRDVLDWPHVDAGHGWLIFAMPPSEVGVHPIMEGDSQSHQLYLMCEDIKQAVAALEKQGIQCAPIQDAGFGIMTSFELPGGGPLGMYQPRHPIAAGKKKRKPATKKATKPGSRSPERKRRVSAQKLTKATKPRPAAKKPTKKTKKASASPARKGGGTKKKPAKKPARKPTKKR